MTKKSAEPSTRKSRAHGSKATVEATSPKGSSDFVMMRFGRIEEMNRSFDIEYWQRQGDAAIFRAAWELVEAYWRDRGLNPDELRLQRSVEAFTRPDAGTARSPPTASPARSRPAARAIAAPSSRACP